MAIKIQQVDPAYRLKSRVDLTLDYAFNIIRSPLHGYSHGSALINKPNEFVLHFLSPIFLLASPAGPAWTIDVLTFLAEEETGLSPSQSPHSWCLLGDVGPMATGLCWKSWCSGGKGGGWLSLDLLSSAVF